RRSRTYRSRAAVSFSSATTSFSRWRRGLPSFSSTFRRTGFGSPTIPPTAGGAFRAASEPPPALSGWGGGPPRLQAAGTRPTHSITNVASARLIIAMLLLRLLFPSESRSEVGGRPHPAGSAVEWEDLVQRHLPLAEAKTDDGHVALGIDAHH